MAGAMILGDSERKVGGNMKNLFERETIDDVIARIDRLQPARQRQWGKMDVRR